MYRANVAAPDIPASTSAKYPMNWVREVTRPLTSEPYTPMMALGTRKPATTAVSW